MPSLPLNKQQVDLHAYVWVRFDGPVETDEPDDVPVKETPVEHGVVTKEYKWRRVREDEEGNIISQYVKDHSWTDYFQQNHPRCIGKLRIYTPHS